MHPLFWVIIVIGIFTARFTELLLLFCIVFVHELVMRLPQRIIVGVLNKYSFCRFGGVVEIEEHGNKSLKEELIVVIAGPIQHIWMMRSPILLYISGLGN